MAAVVGWNMGQERTRACMVCDSWFVTEIMADGSYTEGYYFGLAPVIWDDEPALAPNQHTAELEIWECNDCYHEIESDGTADD